LYPDWRFTNLAQRAGIPIVRLTDYLEDYANQHKVFLNGWPEGQLGAGHWNEVGERIAGERLAEQFCPLLKND